MNIGAVDLSLYSTATQNHSRWVLFLSPNAKDSTFALPKAKNTNMLVSLALGDTNILHHLTQNPQCQSVEYRLRLVPNANFLCWPCTFLFFFVDFICVG